MQQERKATFCMPAQHCFVTNDHDLEARWCQLTLKPHTWPLHCLTIIKSVLQIVLPMRAALQVTKRVAADVSWAYILHNNCRHKNKKRQEQLASHAGCQLNAYIASNIFSTRHQALTPAIYMRSLWADILRNLQINWFLYSHSLILEWNRWIIAKKCASNDYGDGARGTTQKCQEQLS